MRRNDIDRKQRTKAIKQPIVLTSREIMADLLYPAPVDAPRRPRSGR